MKEFRSLPEGREQELVELQTTKADDSSRELSRIKGVYKCSH